jgi:hypothetical protein
MTYKDGADYLRGIPGVPAVYSCNVSYAMQYYSQGRYTMVDSAEKADYIVCEYEENIIEGHSYPVVATVEKDGVPILLVRRNPNPAR